MTLFRILKAKAIVEQSSETGIGNVCMLLYIRRTKYLQTSQKSRFLESESWWMNHRHTRWKSVIVDPWNNKLPQQSISQPEPTVIGKETTYISNQNWGKIFLKKTSQQMVKVKNEDKNAKIVPGPRLSQDSIHQVQCHRHQGHFRNFKDHSMPVPWKVPIVPTRIPWNDPWLLNQEIIAFTIFKSQKGVVMFHKSCKSIPFWGKELVLEHQRPLLC